MRNGLLKAAMVIMVLAAPQLASAAPLTDTPNGNGAIALFSKPYGFSKWTTSANANDRRDSIRSSSDSDSWLALRDRRMLDDTIDMLQVDIHDARDLDDADVAHLVQARLYKTEKSCKRGGSLVSWRPSDEDQVIASNMYVCQQDRYKGPKIFQKVGVGVAVWAMREGNSVFVFQYVGFRPTFKNNDVERISAQMDYRANKVWPINVVMQHEMVASNTQGVAAN